MSTGLCNNNLCDGGMEDLFQCIRSVCHYVGRSDGKHQHLLSLSPDYASSSSSASSACCSSAAAAGGGGAAAAATTADSSVAG